MRVFPFLAAVLAVLAIACGPSGPEIEATIDARVQAALASVPTVTPQPTATPAPTASVQPPPTLPPQPTPQPTATPQPWPTPAPTATPQPEPTPQPTATPAPTSTPQPAATQQPLGSSTDLYQQLRRSVMEIRAGGNLGTGWAIEDGWIITNSHVVESATTVTVIVPTDSGVKSVTGLVRAKDTKRDLAAIEVDHGAPVLPTRRIDARDSGMPIVQIGYSAGLGGFPSIHTGVVAVVVRHLGNVLDQASQRVDDGSDDEGVGVIITDAAADPGDSGGPVIDLEGRVVGITFASTVSTDGGKRVLGQQKAVAMGDVDRVWEDLKNGIDTSSQ